jgi:hypothetical protein
MAEILAVVGIVANIIQLVDFGSRALKRLGLLKNIRLG